MDKSQNIAYCHVPKAASTTWMVAFAKNNNVSNYIELLQKDLLHEKILNNNVIDPDRLMKENTTIFTFTFIRHPFHRIVSNQKVIAGH